MKTILFLIIMISSSFASYSVVYTDLKLGIIQDINTVKDNYFKAELINPVAKFLLGKSELLYYNDKYKTTKRAKEIDYKKDRYYIIEIIKRSIMNNLEEGKIFISDNKYIDIQKDDNYKFKYISNGKIKSYGTINIENSELISLIDEKNRVRIIKD